MNINDAMNPLELLDRAGKLFGLPRDQVLDERRKKVVPVPQFVEVTDAASGRTGEAKANAPTAVAARVVSKQDRYTVHAGGDLNVVFTNHPASNPVTTAFSRWQTVNFSNQPSGRQVAVFRLTNEENRSILLWNVRVEISSAGPTTEVSGLAGVHGGWEAVQNDYPHGGPNDSAIIEAG